MEMTSYEHGVPSWTDIGTPDPEKAAAFYSALFGWECPEGPPETGGYRNATLNGKSVAGIGPQMNPAAPPTWLTYINVDSADEIADKVTAAGGATLMPPMDVMQFGRMAVFADPTGAVFGVWQPGSHIGAQLVNEPGTLCWNELMTTDIEASKAFYGSVFGWGAETSDGGEMPYTEWKLGERSIGGMMPKPPMVPAEVPPNWMVYFAVADLDASVAKLADLGGAVLMPATDTPAGRFCVVMDPQGATFNLICLADELSQG